MTVPELAPAFLALKDREERAMRLKSPFGNGCSFDQVSSGLARAFFKKGDKTNSSEILGTDPEHEPMILSFTANRYFLR
jgi:hypothetical protein